MGRQTQSNLRHGKQEEEGVEREKQGGGGGGKKKEILPHMLHAAGDGSDVTFQR